MTPEPVTNRDWIADVLDAVAVVDWDRFTVGEMNGHQRVTVYGWIGREDAHADFVLVHLWPATEDIDFTTSSAEYTGYLHHEWFDGPIAEHNECRRVAGAFDVANAIELHDQATLEVGDA